LACTENHIKIPCSTATELGWEVMTGATETVVSVNFASLLFAMPVLFVTVTV
jgi:hypothetical protein